jgi:hypothetical protein
LRFNCRDDGEDLDFFFGDVMEHAEAAKAWGRPTLWGLDPPLGLCGFEAQVRFERLGDGCPVVSRARAIRPPVRNDARRSFAKASELVSMLDLSFHGITYGPLSAPNDLAPLTEAPEPRHP